MIVLSINYTSPMGHEGFVYLEATDMCDRAILDASAELERQGFEVASIDAIGGDAAPKPVLQ